MKDYFNFELYGKSIVRFVYFNFSNHLFSSFDQEANELSRMLILKFNF